ELSHHHQNVCLFVLFSHSSSLCFFTFFFLKLFKGKFYYCVGLDVKNITNKSDCLTANYRWVHHKYNFDNLGQALMSLFVLASKDGWVNIMYHGLDAVGIDQQVITNTCSI
ncbi:Voltage-dependent T-type calcium channel subunit alpha-1I, partial [Goodea atripinnis]